jgi:hypothetical protein
MLGGRYEIHREAEMKKRVLRLFRRQLPSPKPPPEFPEFGVRLTLKKGDKIVSRDARGEIRMTRVGEDQPVSQRARCL